MWSDEMSAKCSSPPFMLSKSDVVMCSKRTSTGGIVVTIVILLILCISLIKSLSNRKKIEKKSQLDREQSAAELKESNRVVKDTAEHTTEMNRISDERRKAEKIFVFWPILLFIICVPLVILLLPKMILSIQLSQHRQREYQKSMMKEAGMNQADVFKQQQRLYETNKAAESRLQAARIQARAMDRNTRAITRR